VAIVYEAKVNDVDGDFWVIAGAQLVPDLLLELLLRDRGPAAGGLGRHLQPQGVGIFALDAEHVPVHDDGVTPAEGLGDVSLLTFCRVTRSPTGMTAASTSRVR